MGDYCEQYYLPRRIGCCCHVRSQHVGFTLMTQTSITSVDTAYVTPEDESDIRSGSYVDWPCAFGGAVIAAALTSLLLAFGSGLGLSLTSPWPSERINGTAFGIIMIIWTVFVPLLSFAVGGYFAGRLRRPWQHLAKEEVAFRDAAHGALVWATSVIIGVLTLGMLASGIANVAGSAMSAAGNMASSPGMSSAVDNLFRSEKPLDDNMRATREEAQRMIGTTGAMALSDTDQTYLSGLIARSTGLPAAEASQRVTDAMTTSRSAAETARKASVVAAFFTAATLLMGLAVAWFAARMGGEHRDKVAKRM